MRAFEQKGCSMCQPMRDLLALYRLIPVATALVERGFSQHRRIKGPLTNKTKVINVDARMRVWDFLSLGESQDARNEALAMFANRAAEGSLLDAAMDAYRSGAGAAAGGAIAGETNVVPVRGLDFVRKLQQSLCDLSKQEWQAFVEGEGESFEGWDGIIGGAGADESEDGGEAVDVMAWGEGEGGQGEAGEWMDGTDSEEDVPTAAQPVKAIRPRRTAAAAAIDKLQIMALVEKDPRFANI